MNNMQNMIVYMWFVPAVGFIVLPLFWSLCGILYRVVERSRLMDIRGYVVLNNQDAEGTGAEENRSRPRIRIEEGRACIDGECNCFRASVSNISNHGICLRDIPGKILIESSPLRILFRTRHKDYTFMAKPVWKKMAEKGYVIGAEIQKIPAEWKDLVRELRQSLVAEPAGA